MSTRRLRPRVMTRAAAVRLAALALVLAALLGAAYAVMIPMPGESFTGPLPGLTEVQRGTAARLRADVEMLADGFPRRNVFDARQYAAAADVLAARLERLGYAVEREAFTATLPGRGGGTAECVNVVASRRRTSRPDEIVVLGAHYDTFSASPGANDNASGVAAVLELARRFAARPAPRTLRLVLFANEEPPFFRTDSMGSLVHARACRARGDDVVAMLSLETIGCYRDEPGSQDYPLPLSALYPDRGDFIGFVSNVRSRRLLRDVVGSFRAHAEMPSEGGALPGALPGVGWSDHWAFWQAGYPALMITDTAPYRYPHYHRPSDTPDKVDDQRMARVVDGLEPVVARLLER